MDAIIAATVVYATLAGAALALNRHIDAQPVKRPDGITSLWVVVGVAGTLAGATVLLGLAWPVLASLGELHGAWAAAVGCGVVVASAFAASGLPMILGDAKRSAELRVTHEAVEEARANLRQVR